MSTFMIILGLILFFGAGFLALAQADGQGSGGGSGGIAALLAIVGIILFILAGPQRKREREERMHKEVMEK